MLRTIAIGVSILILTAAPAETRSQASKQLDERAKKVATSQEQSWKQVDEINKETDKTKSRYQQARQSGSQTGQKSGYTVKKSSAGMGSPYKKPSPPRKKTTTKSK